MSSYEEPPSLQNGKGSRSPPGNSGIDFSYLYRVSIRGGGNIQGLAVHGIACGDSLHQHKIMDLVSRKDD